MGTSTPNPKGRRKAKPELSLLSEFLEQDDHFQGGKYDKPIHMRKDEARTSIASDVPLKEKQKPSKELQDIEIPSITPVNDLGSNQAFASTSTPISSENDPNLEKTKLQHRDDIEKSKRKPIDNLEKTQTELRENIETIELEPRENLENSIIARLKYNPQNKMLNQSPSAELPRENLEKTPEKLGDDIEKTSIKPREDLENSIELENESSRKPREQPREQPREKFVKTERQHSSAVPFSSLVGLQRRMTLFFYAESLKSRDRITDPITSAHLAQACQTAVLNAQNTAKEIIKKRVASRAEFKNGRGGWTRYELADNVFQEIISLEANGKLRDILDKNQLKPREQPREQPRDASSSNSSLNSSIKENTTRSESNPPNFDALPLDWKMIDLTPLGKRVDLHPNTLLGIYRAQASTHKKDGTAHLGQPLTLDEIQESINRMAYDLEKGWYDHAFGKTQNPGALLISGLMNRQIYTARSPGYLSPKIQALQERTRKAQEEAKAEQDLKESLFKAVYEIWWLKQDTRLLKKKKKIYAGCPSSEILKITVEDDFREQNWERIIIDGVEDPNQLSLSDTDARQESARGPTHSDSPKATEIMRHVET